MINKKTIYAAIFGAVVADALGVPYEFQSRSQMKKQPATTMTGYGSHNQPVGSWSDDSSMTLATMDSLTKGINYEDMMTKFCQWLQNAKYTPGGDVFDKGITTRKALINHIIDNKKALDCGETGERDNGNGSLMRIMPAILYANAKKLTVKEQMELMDNISSLTHAHKISKASCNIYNFVAQEVINEPEKELKENIINAIDKTRKYYENDEYPCFNRIYNNLFQLKEDDLSSKGYVVYALEVALYMAYHTTGYKESVLNAVNLGLDTDTNAMITGGLTALNYGYDEIPEEWLTKIIKKEEIEKLCDKFYESLQE